MTEFEMVSILQGQRELIGTGLMNFFTILTAYLAAGYLAAHRLNLSMVLFVTTMFVVASSFWLMNVWNTYLGTKALITKMQAFASSGKGLEWAPVATASPDVVDPFVFAAFALMCAGILGGIYFFFHTRRSGQSTAPNAAA